MDLSKFDLLEGKITSLLDKIKELEKLNGNLSQELSSFKEGLTSKDEIIHTTGQKLNQATEQLKSLTQERQIILDKLDALLARFE